MDAPLVKAMPSNVSTTPLILLVGNPNVGKTTLFNALTGERARVGNYPGVTVEKHVGSLELPAAEGASHRTLVTDVPGAYSLSARSAEEQIAINAALGLAGNPSPNLVCVVLDAGQLARNAYLVLQLIELQVPLLLILNMIDEVASNAPSATAISALFGVPCVATNARQGQGLVALKAAIANALAEPAQGTIPPNVAVAYPRSAILDVETVADALPPEWRRNTARDQALARWALCSIDANDELEAIPEQLRRVVLDVQSRALHRASSDGDAGASRDLDQEIIAARYAWLDERLPQVYLKPAPPAPTVAPAAAAPTASPALAVTERIDRVLLHPVYGFAIFVLIMTALFQSLFSWAQPAIQLTEWLIQRMQGALVDWMQPSLLRDALVEGVIGGVGNVLVFLPQILLLFLFIGVLEDSGYMARVAYLMDRILKAVGLHGRAFVPMLSGFACAIPAIMGTRTMERQKDRLLTMLVVPLMSCSARLPVYSLIIVALFPASYVLGFIPTQGLLMVSMYLFSILMSLLAAWFLGRTAVKARRVPLILELPRYRVPKLSGIARMAGERALDFLREAGTLILACTMVLWVLLSFPKRDFEHAPISETTHSAATATVATPAIPSAIEYSYGGRLGKALEPVLEPLGFDWKIGVGLIGAFAAREVFVSTLGLVYELDDAGDDDQPLREKIQAERAADGTARYTPLVGLSLMIFFALACQCMSTLAVVKRETRTWRWPLFLFSYMTVLAYVTSFVVFQTGRLLGF
jgi:ferrous iron transport protein B